MTTILPSEGIPGICDAILDAIVNGGDSDIVLTDGEYSGEMPIVYDPDINDRSTACNGIRLIGQGHNTVIRHSNTFADYLIVYHPLIPVNGVSYGDIEAGDSSVTISPAYKAGPVKKGDVLTFLGTDVDGIPDAEVHIAAADGNPSTGVVPIVDVILRTMTGVTDMPNPNCHKGVGLSFMNFRMVLDDVETPMARGGIQLATSVFSTIESIEAEGFEHCVSEASDSVFSMWDNVWLTMKKCRVFGSKNSGIYSSSTIYSLYDDCLVQGSGSGAMGGFKATGSFGNVLDRFVCEGALNNGVVFGGSQHNRRNAVRATRVLGPAVNGIVAFNTSDSVFDTCVVESANRNSSSYGFYNSFGSRNRLTKSTFSDCKYSVYSDAGDDIDISGNDIHRGGAYGIVQGNGDRAKISSNTINGGGNGDPAIYVYDAEHAYVGPGNTVKRNSGNSVTLANSVSNSRVVSNIVPGRPISLGSGSGNSKDLNIE